MSVRAKRLRSRFMRKGNRKRHTSRLRFETLERRVVLESHLGDTPLPDDATDPPVPPFRGFDAVEQLQDYLIDAAWDRWSGFREVPDQADDGLDPLHTVDAVAHAMEAGADDAAGLAQGPLRDLTSFVAPSFFRTDGELLYHVNRGELSIVDASAPEDLRLLSQIGVNRLAREMHLHDDHVSLVGAAPALPYALGELRGGAGSIHVSLLDVSDPSDPQVAERIKIDGQLVGSHADGNLLYVVSQAHVPLPRPRIVCSGLDPETGEDGAHGSEDHTKDTLDAHDPDGTDDPEAQDPGARDPAGTEDPDAGDPVPADPDVGPIGDLCEVESHEAFADRVRDHIVEFALPHYESATPGGGAAGRGLLVDPLDVMALDGAGARNLVSITVIDVAADPPPDDLPPSDGAVDAGSEGEDVEEDHPESRLAPVFSVEVHTRAGGGAHRAVAEVVSGLPDGCSEYSHTEVVQRDHHFDVDIYNHERPDAVCAAVFRDMHHRVLLGEDLAPGDYTLDVNGIAETFRIEAGDLGDAAHTTPPDGTHPDAPRPEREPLNSTSVFASRVVGMHVGEGSLYTAGLSRGEDGSRSEILQFALGEGGAAEVSLSAVGEVAGRAVHPNAMDAHEGVLRVATSVGQGESRSTSLSMLTRQGDVLEVAGAVEGLVTGSGLSSLLYVDAQAVLATRGPGNALVTLDLSDPAAPAVVGDLAVDGVLTQLVPIDDGVLLTVGLHGESDRLFRVQPQIGLLDISDPAEPVWIDQFALASEDAKGLFSAALWDPSAITYSAAHGVLAMPVAARPHFDLPGRDDRPDTFPPEHDGPTGDLPGDEDEIAKDDPPIDEPTGEPPTADDHPADAGETGEGERVDLRSVVDAARDFFRDRVRPERELPFSELWVFNLDPASGEDAIQLAARIDHGAPMRRSLAEGDWLFAASTRLISSHRLDDPGTTVDQLSLGPIGAPDRFTVEHGSDKNVLDVLANDGVDEAKIVEVSETRHGGIVEIADDGQLLYTPPAVGREDAFRYLVRAADGRENRVLVSVRISHEAVRDRMVKLAMQDLAERREIPVDEIHLVRAHYTVWPDSCLGVPSEEGCADVLTPGFKIVLRDDAQLYTYHTDTVERVVFIEPVDPPILVNPDHFQVDQNSRENVLDVLRNDFRGIEFFRAPEITAVSEPSAGGTVEIVKEGQLLVYSPPADFTGQETFEYTVDGFDSALVTVDVIPVIDVISIRLEAAVDEGAIESLKVGQEFVLNLYVEDVRDATEAQGVFSAYVNVLFDPSIAEVSGDVQFGSEYANGQSGETSSPGHIRLLGAFAGLTPLGPGEFLLASVPMTAVGPGELGITSHPHRASTPGYEYLVYGVNHPVPVNRVAFGAVDLRVEEPALFQNPVDPEDVDGNGTVTPRDALVNINKINAEGIGRIRADGSIDVGDPEVATPGAEGEEAMYYDVNGDDTLSPIDVLLVILELNEEADGQDPAAAEPAEGEGSPVAAVGESAAPESGAETVPLLVAADLGGEAETPRSVSLPDHPPSLLVTAPTDPAVAPPIALQRDAAGRTTSREVGADDELDELLALLSRTAGSPHDAVFGQLGLDG